MRFPFDAWLATLQVINPYHLVSTPHRYSSLRSVGGVKKKTKKLMGLQSCLVR
jgi:hypothetical protein